jgi:hypothetical protein
MCDITAADIRVWQNELIRQGYSPTYLKSIHCQLSAVFNYAVKYYDLPRNPCTQAGSMGKSSAQEMQFWTQLGAQPNLVAERLGHEKIQTTLYTYSHLYPNQSRHLAEKLNDLVDTDEEES